MTRIADINSTTCILNIGVITLYVCNNSISKVGGEVNNGSSIRDSLDAFDGRSRLNSNLISVRSSAANTEFCVNLSCDSSCTNSQCSYNTIFVNSSHSRLARLVCCSLAYTCNSSCVSISLIVCIKIDGMSLARSKVHFRLDDSTSRNRGVSSNGIRHIQLQSYIGIR